MAIYNGGLSIKNVSIDTNGGGNAITSLSADGNVITATKGTTFLSSLPDHDHNYAGSASAGGSANSTQALDGFTRQTNQTWGVQTGTFVHGEGVNGCDWGFRKNCPSSGMVSLVVDGKFYQNEGRYACIDTSGGTITGNLTVNNRLYIGNASAYISYNSSTGALEFNC